MGPARTVVRDGLSPDWPRSRAQLGRTLLDHLHRRGMFRTWLRDKPEGWELVSGVWSPFYIQARNVPSHPEVLRFVGDALAQVIRNEVGECEQVVGLAMAGIPLATAAALQLGVPMCYTRKLPGVRTLEDLATRPKDYGDHSMVEGELANGTRVVLVDDVSAQFTSKQIAHWQVTEEIRNRRLRGVSIPAVVVLVDREQGSTASVAAAQLGMSVLSVVRLKSEGLDLLRGILLPREHEIISAYVANPSAFQDISTREVLTSEGREFQSNLNRS
jgi:orotate phosphoribosyltransferase